MTSGNVYPYTVTDDQVGRDKKTRITYIISREICIVSFSYHEFFEFPLKGAEEIE